jgi:hypothetical protein
MPNAKMRHAAVHLFIQQFDSMDQASHWPRTTTQ